MRRAFCCCVLTASLAAVGGCGGHYIFISSAWGLPKSIVDGRFASDLFVVRRSGRPEISVREIGVKKSQFVLHPREGVRRAEVPDHLQQQQSLSDEEAIEIADAAVLLALIRCVYREDKI